MEGPGNFRLKKCPFCLSKNIDPTMVIGHTAQGKKFFSAGCWDCGASGPEAFSPEESVAKWNDRERDFEAISY